RHGAPRRAPAGRADPRGRDAPLRRDRAARAHARPARSRRALAVEETYGVDDRHPSPFGLSIYHILLPPSGGSPERLGGLAAPRTPRKHASGDLRSPSRALPPFPTPL